MAERQEKSFQTTLKGYRKGGRGKRRGGLGTPPRAGEDLFISFQRRGGGEGSLKKKEIKYIWSIRTGNFLCSPGEGEPREGKTLLNDPFFPAERGQGRRAPRGSGGAVTATQGGWAAQGDAGREDGAAGSTGLG